MEKSKGTDQISKTLGEFRKLPELIETDNRIFLVKYNIESITYRKPDLRPSFFVVKSGGNDHYVTEGIPSFKELSKAVLGVEYL